MEIVLHGRSDLDAFFDKSDVLTAAKLAHHPFLAFIQEGDGAVHVRRIDTAADVVRLPEETPLLIQWPGQWRSDYFKLTAGDVARARSARDLQ